MVKLDCGQVGYVAVWVDDGSGIIPNDQGSRTTLYMLHLSTVSLRKEME